MGWERPFWRLFQYWRQILRAGRSHTHTHTHTITIIDANRDSYTNSYVHAMHGQVYTDAEAASYSSTASLVAENS